MIGWMHRIFFQRVDTHRWFPRKKISQVHRTAKNKKQTNERRGETGRRLGPSRTDRIVSPGRALFVFV